MVPIPAVLLETQTLLYILFFLCALVVVLLLSVAHLARKVKRFTMGKSGASLEESFQALKTHYDSTAAFRATIEQYLQSVEARLRKSIQGTETIRFNPFEGDGSGGNQSFATALLNETGDGVVFSSIYARDRMCVFAKPIKGFSSDHELSQEEREAITKARMTLPPAPRS